MTGAVDDPSGNELPNRERIWHLYVLECADESLYCGIALDVEKRLSEHQRGKGAKYTRARLPVKLTHSNPVGPLYSDALKAEHAFKRLSRKQKLARISPHECAKENAARSARNGSTRPD